MGDRKGQRRGVLVEVYDRGRVRRSIVVDVAARLVAAERATGYLYFGFGRYRWNIQDSTLKDSLTELSALTTSQRLKVGDWSELMRLEGSSLVDKGDLVVDECVYMFVRVRITGGQCVSLVKRCALDGA